MSVRKRYKEDGSFVWEFCITISKHPRKQYRKSGFKKRDEAVEAEREAITKFKNGYNLTSESSTFKELAEMGIKATIQYSHYEDGTPKTMWNLIPKKKLPPTRLMRWCCAELKEWGGEDACA